MHVLRRKVWGLLALAGVGCGVPVLGDGTAEPPPAPYRVPAPAAASEPDDGTVRVARVYDGDTLTLASGDKVRLQWVNTPERQPEEPFAMDAQRFAERFVRQGPVRLVTRGTDPRDRYGRLLAGVTTPQGDLAEGLLRAGLAHVFILPPAPDHVDQLLAAEAQARRLGLGIWSTSSFQGPFHMTSFHANAPGDDTTNVNGERLRLCNVSGRAADLGGFRLEDRSGRSFVLEPLTVPPGHTVQVYSGVGAPNRTPSRQLTAYLGSSVPVWNNQHETVTLLDPQGRVLSRRTHRGRAR